MANIAIDLDGTLVEKQWPEVGEWMPGAIDAVKEMLAAGHHVYLYTARLSSKHPSGDDKDPAMLFVQRAEVRELLDAAGLAEVDIYEGDKPFWHLLIDDRAMRFPGRRRSWERILPAVLARVASHRNRH
jgi:hypothetical protein